MTSLADYELKQKLGAGSFGTVYKAIRKSDGKPVVVKQVKIHEMKPAEKKVALAEVRVMNQFRSKFVVRCEGESFIEDDHLNMILEYCDAGDVKQYLAKQKKPLKERTIRRIMVQLMLGLHHIHSKRVIHRDIKAANLFLCSHMRRVKIGDLGVARTLGATASMAQTMVGTPYYMSPELVQGELYDAKSDVWAAGCLLYELMTLRHPFNAANQAALLMSIMRGKFEPVQKFGGKYSTELHSLVKWMLCKNVKRRLSVDDILSKDFFHGWILENGFENPLVDSVAAGGLSSTTTSTADMQATQQSSASGLPRGVTPRTKGRGATSKGSRPNTSGPSARSPSPAAKGRKSRQIETGRGNRPSSEARVQKDRSSNRKGTTNVHGPGPAARSPRSSRSPVQQSTNSVAVSQGSDLPPQRVPRRTPSRRTRSADNGAYVGGNRRRDKRVPVRSTVYVPPTVVEQRQKAAADRRKASQQVRQVAERSPRSASSASRAQDASHGPKRSGSVNGVDYDEVVEEDPSLDSDSSNDAEDKESDEVGDDDAWSNPNFQSSASLRKANPYAAFVFGKTCSRKAIRRGHFEHQHTTPQALRDSHRERVGREDNKIAEGRSEPCQTTSLQQPHHLSNIIGSDSVVDSTATCLGGESTSRFNTLAAQFRKSDPLRQLAGTVPWTRVQRCAEMDVSVKKEAPFAVHPTDARRVAAILEALYLQQLHDTYPNATVCGGMTDSLAHKEACESTEQAELSASLQLNNFAGGDPASASASGRSVESLAAAAVAGVDSRDRVEHDVFVEDSFDDGGGDSPSNISNDVKTSTEGQKERGHNDDTIAILRKLSAAAAAAVEGAQEALAAASPSHGNTSVSGNIADNFVTAVGKAPLHSEKDAEPSLGSIRPRAVDTSMVPALSASTAASAMTPTLAAVAAASSKAMTPTLAAQVASSDAHATNT